MAYRAALPQHGADSATSRILEICPIGVTDGRICGRQRLGPNPNLVRARLKNPPQWRRLLTVYLAALAIVGFWPTPVDKPIHGTLDAMLKYLHSHGVPPWFEYHFVEASANVAMFIPFGILIALALPSKTWWQLASIALVTSTCMELGQLLFLAARYASLVDVVTNTVGAVIGISVVRLAVSLKTYDHARQLRLRRAKGTDGARQR